MKRTVLITCFFILSISLMAQKSNLQKSITILSDSLFQLVEMINRDTIVIGTLTSHKPEVKSGIFLFYNKNGKLTAKGNYMENLPAGKWSYYYRNGKVKKEIDYSKIIEILNDTVMPQETFFVVESMPKFQGVVGIDKFREYIKGNLTYPIYPSLKGIQGRAFVQFIINEYGKVCNVQIKGSTGDKDLDMEAIRVVSESPLWQPGSLKGKSVAVLLMVPISFY